MFVEIAFQVLRIVIYLKRVYLKSLCSKMELVTKKRANDHTKYSFNGYGVYGKGRLALEIVKRFVKDNPNMSYKELQAKIPLPVMSYSEIQSWKFSTEDKSKDRRWFEDNSDLMKSFDGVVFAFTNQIGKDNIGEMIKFALRQGYKIDILNNVK